MQHKFIYLQKTEYIVNFMKKNDKYNLFIINNKQNKLRRF